MMYLEEKSNVWQFWGTFLWGLVIIVLLLLGQVLPIWLYLQFIGDAPESMNAFIEFLETIETDAFLISLSAIGSAIIVVPLVLLIAKFKRGSNLQEYFGFYKISWKTFASWMGILVLLLVFETFFLGALGVEETPSFMMNIEFPTIYSMWILVFAVVFMAPLIEEVVFRGFLLKGFSKSFIGVSGAVVITSALWAMMHMQYEKEYVLVIFVVGIVFGIARIHTNSILTPMIMHFFMNLIASVGLFYEKGMV